MFGPVPIEVVVLRQEGDVLPGRVSSGHPCRKKGRPVLEEATPVG